MAGCRSLSVAEERALIRVARRLAPRDRALIITQLFTGFRISEVLSLTVGSVFKADQIVSKIGVAPRNLKGGYGRTRWVPMLPELERALHALLHHLRQRYQLTADLPLFLSRQDNSDGTARVITRERAHQLFKTVFARVGIVDDGRLGTHVLRKTFARNVYRNSGKDLMVLKKALNHSSVAITQRYLEAEEDDVLRAIRRCDRSRGPKPKHPEPPSVAEPPQRSQMADSAAPVGFEVPAPIGQLDFWKELNAA